MDKVRGFEVVDKEYRKTDGRVTVKLPKRATKHSAGYDFYTPIAFTLKPHGTIIIPTDVKAYMQDDEVLKLYIRSSIAIKRGVKLSNTPIIDSDYHNNPDNDGNILLSFTNTTKNTVRFKKGERIAQGIFVKYLVADDDNVETERYGGIGSSNKGDE